MAVAGCGRLGFAPVEPPSDAPPDAQACASFGSFGPPARLPGMLHAIDDDWAGAPTLDETRVYFYSFRNSSGGDLYVATRATATGDFGIAQKIVELDLDNNNRDPSITDDELLMVFDREVGKGPPAELVTVTRSSTTVPWDTAVPIAELNTGGDEVAPWISGDGLRLVFSSARFGSFDLFETTRATRTDEFAAPVVLEELSDDVMQDSYPTVSANGLEIFFTSNRPGGPGDYDVYTASRPAIDQPFGAPVLVPELSSTRDEAGLRLSADGRTIYLNYDAVLEGGTTDISAAVRSCL